MKTTIMTTSSPIRARVRRPARHWSAAPSIADHPCRNPRRQSFDALQNEDPTLRQRRFPSRGSGCGVRGSAICPRPIASHRVRRTPCRANIQIQACDPPRSQDAKARGGYARRHSDRQLGRCCSRSSTLMWSSFINECGRHVAPPRIRLGVPDLSPGLFIP